VFAARHVDREIEIFVFSTPEASIQLAGIKEDTVFIYLGVGFAATRVLPGYGNDSRGGID
jgi:hypothetical protein